MAVQCQTLSKCPHATISGIISALEHPEVIRDQIYKKLKASYIAGEFKTQPFPP